MVATTLSPPFHCHVQCHKCCAHCCSLFSSKQAVVHVVRVVATFAVSWRSRDDRTGSNIEDHARRADAHDLRAAEPFCTGRGKLRMLAVGYFVEKSGK